MSQAAILALFTTLSQEERVETVQSLVALLGGASSSGGAPAKKIATQRSAKVSAASQKETKEKVSRGPSDWTQYVMAVRAETGLKMAEAMAEASRRREASDPDCPLPPKTAAKKPSVASAAAAAAAPKPKKTKEEVVVVAAAAAEEEESAELEEVEVEGQDYLYLPAAENAAWLKEADGSRGAWAGYLNTETGEFDTSRPAPELADE
jgi:hypothetical protein